LDNCEYGKIWFGDSPAILVRVTCCLTMIGRPGKARDGSEYKLSSAATGPNIIGRTA
jgi:hypothetical protein